MEQRPLRLGDIVDDYCPRERRITNHAVVAIVDDAIKQTRCTACEAEHVYKEAKAPRPRKKSPPGSLYEEVLTSVTGGQPGLPPRPNGADTTGEARSAAAEAAEAEAVEHGAAAHPNGSVPETSPPADEADRSTDLWVGHRPLIRATLPRVEGEQPPARPIPEFTMHQRNMRGFRQSQGWQVDGNRAGFRSGQPGRGQGHGQGHGGHGHGGHGQGGQGHGQGGGRHGRHHGKHKRSR